MMQTIFVDCFFVSKNYGHTAPPSVEKDNCKAYPTDGEDHASREL